MNQEKFGMLIKEIRKKYNLTQKQLGDKYNVTYQAVSKWENGKNMPDIALIKQISNDFNISLEELFEGEFKDNKKNSSKKITFLIMLIIVLFVILLVILLKVKNNNFQFKTLSSNCEIFKISGNISYNKSKTAIYINNIEYCGGEDIENYKYIECILYESDNNIDKKISSLKYNENKSIKLEEFLQDIEFAVDNYENSCKQYSENSLYLLINATNDNNKITSYKIPLVLNDTCQK